MMIPSFIPPFLVHDPQRLIWLLGGYLMAQIVEAVKDKVQHHRVRRVSAAGVIGVVMVTIAVWIAAKTEQNYEYTKDVADKSATCWVSFGENMTARSAIASDNDRLTIVNLTAVNNLLHDIAQAPSKGLSAEEQLQLLQTRAAQAYGVGDQVLTKLISNQAERAAHPLKVPVCALAR